MPMFWIVAILLSLWVVTILVMSVAYMVYKRREIRKQEELRKEKEEVHENRQENRSLGTQALPEQETTVQFFAKILSVQYNLSRLTRLRSEDIRYDDLRIMDGMRVFCLLWVMMLGVSQFTMSSAVFNPWTLQHYF